MKSRIISLAKGFSFLGHPLILGTAYVAWMSFLNLPRSQAWYITLAVVLTLTLPITVHNWRKLKSGAYANFDVSDQNQRKGFYHVAIGLFLALILVLWLMNVPKEVIYHTLLVLGMVGLMALVNRKIKASLHAAIALFITVNCFALGIFPGIGITFFSLAIAWSRWRLGRHSLNEIAIGSVFGTVVGLLAVGI
jgi:hypothetical protein